TAEDARDGEGQDAAAAVGGANVAGTPARPVPAAVLVQRCAAMFAADGGQRDLFAAARAVPVPRDFQHGRLDTRTGSRRRRLDGLARGEVGFPVRRTGCLGRGGRDFRPNRQAAEPAMRTAPFHRRSAMGARLGVEYGATKPARGRLRLEGLAAARTRFGLRAPRHRRVLSGWPPGARRGWCPARPARGSVCPGPAGAAAGRWGRSGSWLPDRCRGCGTAWRTPPDS